MNLGLLQRFLIGAVQVDWGTALAKLKSGDPTQEISLAEDVAGIAANLGVPYAAWIKDGLEVLELIETARQLGYWEPAQPEDPAMQRAAGRESGTPQMHQGTASFPGPAEDPLNFDGEDK